MGKPYDQDFNPTATGIFEIPEADYHRIKALNNSSMKVLYDYSPLHFKHKMDGMTMKPITPQQQSVFDMGSVIDLCVFEPDRFKTEVVKAPGFSKNSNKYKEWKEDHNGKIILSGPAYARAKGTAEGVFKKNVASRLLSSGWPQKSIIWKHPVYGFYCKGRTDWICKPEDKFPIVVDLKTTEKAVYHRFKWVARNLRYYWQAYYYLQGLSIATGQPHKEWRWLVAETYPPHESIVYITDADGMEYAGEMIEELCATYANCLEKDEWPGYPDEEVVLGEKEIPEFDITDDDIPY